MTASTGLDEALKLEAVYYSAPVPRDLPTLTVLGTVFDKVYFPGVYLPTSGFDQSELDKDTRIIEASRGNPTRNEILVGILNFIRHAKTLEGFCVFTGHPIRSQPSRPKYCISHFVIKALAISTIDGTRSSTHGPIRIEQTL